jgi:hypothetical protein
MCEWVWIRESLFGTGAGLEEAEVVVVGAGVVEGPAVAGAMVTSEVIFFVVAKRGLRFVYPSWNACFLSAYDPKSCSVPLP